METSEKYKCVIIDDEPIAIRVISNYLKSIQQLECVGEFTNALEALNIINSKKVDLLFLDIQMPGINGLEFIKTLPNPPKVIYTTAFRNYAVDAFEVNAIDYLVKPIPFDRFVKSVNKFLSQMQTPSIQKKSEERTDHIILKSDSKNHKVIIDEILYIESLDDYVKVHTINGKLVCYSRLVVLEELLKNYQNIVRIHRSYMINISHIKSFTNFNVEIEGKELPIGRKYKEQVISKLEA